MKIMLSCSKILRHAPKLFIMLPNFGGKKCESDENNVVMLPTFHHAPIFLIMLPNFFFYHAPKIWSEKTAKFGSMIKNLGA
jgi:hypothetical protein